MIDTKVDNLKINFHTKFPCLPLHLVCCIPKSFYLLICFHLNYLIKKESNTHML